MQRFVIVALYLREVWVRFAIALFVIHDSPAVSLSNRGSLSRSPIRIPRLDCLRL